MNWKFTKLKTITAVVIGILLHLFFRPLLVFPESSWWIYLPSIIAFAVGLGLTYLIWSLIQKKPDQIQTQQNSTQKEVKT